MELLSPPGLPHAETASTIAKAQKSPITEFGLVGMPFVVGKLGLMGKLVLFDPLESQCTSSVLVRVDVEKPCRKKTTSVCMNEV